MNKHLVLFIGLIISGSLARAQTQDEKPEFMCLSGYAAGHQGIEGYALSISQIAHEKYQAHLYPICKTCKVQTSKWLFDKKSAGLETVYSGDEGTLHITMESYAPTKQHAAVLNSKHLNRAEAVPFTCTAESL